MSRLHTLRLFTPAIALAAALALAAPAAFAIEPDETLADIPADDSATTCADPSCDVAFDLPNSTLQVKTTAEDGELNVEMAVISADFSVTAEGGDPEDETKLVGSQISMNVDAEGLLSALAIAPDASAGYRIDVHVTDLDDNVVVAAAKVAEAEGDKTEDLSEVDVSELLVFPVALTRGHSYRVELKVTVTAAAGSGETASADFLMNDGFVSWSNLTVMAGSDPSGDLADLAARVDDLEEEVDDLEEELDELREDFDGHSHEYLTGRGTGHNNTTANTTTPDTADNSDGDDGDDDDITNPGGRPGNNRNGNAWWKRFL